METNGNFEYDLKTGIIAEKYISNILSNKKIEVKKDELAKKTGNVFVEYESRNKPSGIATTKADFYCFVISNENIIFVETNKLKELCKQKRLRKVPGGDSNTSMGVLLPLEQLVKL